MFDWGDVKFFVATARTGSTLAAARQLGVNQTTVARHISALEAALSLRLFDHHHRGYRLSQAGAEILEHAERLSDQADKLERVCAQRSRDLSGVVRVTTTEGLANSIVAPLLAEFMELHPHLTVEVIVSTGRLDLTSGEADIAIRAGPMPTETGMTVRKLADDRWAVFCSQAYAATWLAQNIERPPKTRPHWQPGLFVKTGTLQMACQNRSRSERPKRLQHNPKCPRCNQRWPWSRAAAVRCEDI